MGCYSTENQEHSTLLYLIQTYLLPFTHLSTARVFASVQIALLPDKVSDLNFSEWIYATFIAK